MRSLLALSLALSLAACSKKADPSSDSSAKAGSPADAEATSKAPAAKPTPGGGFVNPPLGAADAIEPPSREIVPGMLISVAKGKGAKPGDVDYLLKFRPDTELWLNKDLDVISNLQVEYPAKDFEAIKAKWGKPTIGDDTWVGANWMAAHGGCANGPCGVKFVRAPMTFLEKTPKPPGALGNLRPGLTAAQVKTETGYAISIGAGSDNGFGWDLSIRYDSADTFDSLGMDIQTGDDSDWIPGLTKLWGAPSELGGEKVWVNAKERWLVQLAYVGDLLTFRPMKPIGDLLAKSGPDSLLALAESLIGKPKTALAKAPGYDAKNERFATLPNEYSLSSPSIEVSTNDKEAISELDVWLSFDNEPDGDKLVKLVSAAWGTISKSKDENDNELQTIAVNGLKVKVEPGTRLSLTITK